MLSALLGFRSMIVVLVVQFVSMGLLFGIDIVVARLVDASTFGMFALYNGLALIVGSISSLGVEQVVLKRSGQCPSAVPSDVIGLTRLSLLIGLPLGTIIYFIFFGNRTLLFVPLMLCVLLTAVGTISLATIAGAVLRVTGRTILAHMFERLFRPCAIFLVLMLGCLIGPGKVWSEDELLAALTIAGLPTMAVAVLILAAWGSCFSLRKMLYDRYSIIHGMRDSTLYLILNLLFFFNAHIAVILLARVAGRPDIGAEVSIAMKIAMLVTLPHTTISAACSARIAQMLAIHTPGSVAESINRYTVYSFLMSIPIVVMIVVGSLWLPDLYGFTYANVPKLVCLLAIFQLTNSGVGMINTYLIMNGRTRDVLRGVIIATLIHVAMLCLPVYYGNNLGCALAYCVFLSIWTRMTCVAGRRISGRAMSAFSLSRSLAAIEELLRACGIKTRDFGVGS
jgi:O-antigen/teichoic acid export membrane protein